VPERGPGDVIQMLNIGGVLRVCDSISPDKGSRSTAACCGRSTFRISAREMPAASFTKLDAHAPLDTRGVPVLAGTCMEEARRPRLRGDRAHAPPRSP
jgi:hypothetical protein